MVEIGLGNFPLTNNKFLKINEKFVTKGKKTVILKSSTNGNTFSVF